MSHQIEELQVQEEKEGLEIDLLELLYYYRTKWVKLAAGFLAGALFAGLFTYYFITPKYTATAKLYMVSASSDSVVDLTDLNLGTSLSSDYEELLKIRPVMEEVAQEQGLGYSYTEMLGMVGISTIADTRILQINVESADAGEAQRIANALAEKAVSYLPEVMEISAPNIAERAIVPEDTSSPSYSTNIMLGALLGLVLTAGVFAFFFVTDDTLNSAEDIEKKFGILPFTVIPEGDIAGFQGDQKEETRHRGRKKRLWRKRRNG